MPLKECIFLGRSCPQNNRAVKARQEEAVKGISYRKMMSSDVDSLENLDIRRKKGLIAGHFSRVFVS